MVVLFSQVLTHPCRSVVPWPNRSERDAGSGAHNIKTIQQTCVFLHLNQKINVYIKDVKQPSRHFDCLAITTGTQQ